MPGYDWAGDVRIYRQHLARWVLVGQGEVPPSQVAALTACAEALLARMPDPEVAVTWPPPMEVK
jgi:hypothetical protein